MPADHGLRPDDLQSVQHARCQPIQPGKHQTVDAAEGQSLRRFTSQHVKLMTKRQDLYLQRRSRSEQSDQRQPNQAANISHQPRASPDSTLLASRIEFPTMTAVGLVGCSDFDVETCCDSQINSVLSADVSFQLAGYCLRCCSQPSAAKAPARTVAPTTKAIPRNARLCRMACLIVPPH